MKRVIYIIILLAFAKGITFPQTWVSLNTGTDFPINDIYFVDAQTGWFVSHSGLIKKTTDGGISWVEQTSNVQTELKKVQFIDINYGLIVGGNGTVLKTTNSGSNWVPLNTGYSGYFYGLDFVNREIGWIVGTDGKIFKTTDGGQTWVNQSPIYNETFKDIDFIDQNVGNVVGTGGMIYRSYLGGADWFQQNINTNLNGGKVQLIDHYNAWIILDQLRKTTNGGTSWPTVSFLYNTTTDLFFLNKDTGWVVTNNGLIGNTIDGGQNFSYVTPIPLQNYNTVFFIDYYTGWIVGSNGVLLKYIPPQNVTLISPNGGENWTIGSTQNISWTQSDVTNVKLEYSINNGSTWLQIVASTPASSGSYSWVVPNTASTSCRIKISDVNNTAITDQSNAVFTISAPVQSLTLSAPNGGESWTVGSTKEISWSYSNVSNVKLEYTTNNGSSWIVIVASTPASGWSYSWVVPNTPSTNCRVKISDASNSQVSDQSNSSFTIASVSGQTITVTSPNGGENWTVGSTQNITWAQTGVTSVKLEYTPNNGTNWYQITASTPASTGTYSWTIPNAVSTGCRVRIADVGNSSITDQSNSVFTISAAPVPSVTVTSPNGGEIWVVGSTKDISWNSHGVSNVKLEYTTNSGTSWIVIVASTPASGGSVSWDIPNTPSPNCKVRITDANNGTISDVSNSNFNITSGAVTVTSPQGGENWIVGNQYSITWTRVNVTSLKIEYTTNSGSSWTTITSSTPAAGGTFSWTVPNTPSTSCKVRLTDANNGTISDVSNLYFTIATSAVTVTSPNGGENWTAVDQYNITWTAVNINNLKIEYSTNSGSSWNSITSSTPASGGSYNWTVPNTPSTSCKVRLTSTWNSTITDQSNSTFTISPPVQRITVTSPNGGEKWLVGNQYSITWNYTNIDLIKAEYSRNNGLDWDLIADNITAGNGSYIWTVPPGESNSCIVRLSSTTDPDVKDQSDQPFTIELERTLSLTAPQNGQVFTSGQSTEIKWNSLNLETVAIHYSIDNGANWLTISDSVVASPGNYTWLIPETNSNLVKIRVAYTRNPLLKSELAGTFTILPSPKVVLHSNLSNAYLKGGGSFTLEWFTENVSGISIYLSTDQGSSWSEVASNIPSTVNTYQWQVPQLNSANCKIKLVSIDNPVLTSISEGSFTIYTYAPTMTVQNSWQFGDISDISNYRMISIPGNTSENLRNVIAGQHINEWNAYWDNGNDANYQVQFDGSETFKFRPGKGFWVLSKNPVDVNRQAESVLIDSTMIFNVAVHRGWNIIGNPFNKQVSWADVKSVNLLAQNSLIYYWDGKWNFPAQMEPYKGYYFFNSDGRANLKLRYPVEAGLAKAGQGSPVDQGTNAVLISFDGSEIVANFDGSASAGLDTNDYMLPNMQFGKTVIGFIKDMENGKRVSLFIESQPEDSLGNIFRFMVSNASATTHDLTFALPKGTDGRNFYLLDEKYSEFIDLRQKSGFSIVTQEGGRYYSLLVGDDTFINSVKSKYLPTEYTLYQNYPNPFNPETIIKYALPVDSRVTLKIYDITGNEITTIEEGYKSVGVHNTRVDLSGMASGVYFYKLETPGNSLIKKMILLK